VALFLLCGERMRFTRGLTAGAKGRVAGSPYRAAGEVRPEEEEGTSARSWAWALVFVLGCSLLRFALFACSEERFGIDPALALALALGSAYTLNALSRASRR
jgi:hypothetical protein